MLAVPADRLPSALADLDPGNRALLDLSLRRGVSDAEIGELLRKDPDDVARGRDAVLGLLADALDLDGPDRRERVRRAVAELPDDAWRAPAPPREEPPEPAPGRKTVLVVDDEAKKRDEDDDDDDVPERLEPFAARRKEPEAERTLPDFGMATAPARERPWGRLLALLGLLAVLVVLGVVVLGGDDDDGGGGRGSKEPGPAEPGPGGPTGGGRSVSLKQVGAGRGSGRLSLGGDGRVVIALRGLPKPAGTYQAWLYNDVADAIPLGTFRAGTGRLPVRLPARAARYRFLDVSLEPADANRNHSGDSVLRAPLAKLLER